MRVLKLTSELRKTIQRCVWFEKPEQAVKNTPRPTAYILTYGMPEDTATLRKQLTDVELEQALGQAPPGIFDARSWAYWNLIVGRYDTPSLPTRTFK